MKKLILALTLWITFAIVGYVQCASIGLTLISEPDGTPSGVAVYKMILPNGTTSISNAVLTYTPAAISYTPDIPNTVVVHTDATYVVTVASDVGKLHVIDYATDVAITLGNGTTDGQIIGFQKADTGNPCISGAIYDEGSAHTLLTGSSLGGEIWLRWSVTLSSWTTMQPGLWTGSTP